MILLVCLYSFLYRSGKRGDDEIASEVIATYSGKRGSARLQRELERSAEMGDWDSVSVYKRVVDGLREMWERVIDWFSGSGLLGKNRLAQYHVDEFCDSMLSDLIGDGGLGDEVKNSNIETANKQFNEQLDEYINFGTKANFIFQLGNPQGAMNLFLPDLPIVMRPRIITKSSQTKHNVDASSLRNLPQMISEPIFIFKRSDDALGILTEIKDRNGKNVCVAIEMNKTIQDGGSVLEVNDIRSIHGRDVANIVLPIAHNNTLVYADKTKGLNWLSSASYNYQQEIDKKDLDLVAKIVKDFENPSVEGEKSNRDVTEDERNNRFADNVGASRVDDLDVRFSMSPATGVSAGDASRGISSVFKDMLREGKRWLRRGSGDTQVDISGSLGEELLGRGINGMLMRVVESWSNGYISLHRVFTHLNEARVKSGLKAYDDVMDLEWRARLA
ncbi:MAG: hypothetical protein ACI392_03570 [Paludibacteraceae bacterium]